MMLKALESYDPNLGVIAPSYRAEMILIADAEGKCTSAKELYFSAQKSMESYDPNLGVIAPSYRAKTIPIAYVEGKCTSAKEP